MSYFPLKKLKIEKGYIATIILGALFFVGIIYAGGQNCNGSHYNGTTNFDCYRAPGTSANPPSAQTQVTEWGDNFCVLNSNALDLFIPTNTGTGSGEMGTFKAHLPGNVTLTQGVCSQSQLSVTCSAVVNPPGSKTVVWSSTPSGGTTPYTYHWTGDQGLDTTSNPTTKTYSDPGTYNGSVVVTDSGNRTATCNASVAVTDPIATVGGDVNPYLPSQYCAPNAAKAVEDAIARARGSSSAYWTGIRTIIANTSQWSALTKANANAVVDQVAPSFSATYPYPIIPNQYWGGSQGGSLSGSKTVAGQTFYWDTNDFDAFPADPCTDVSQPNKNQGYAEIHITGPY